MSEYIFSFSLFAMFSLYPLLIREGQILPYFALNFIFCNVILLVGKMIFDIRNKNKKESQNIFRRFEQKIMWIINLFSIIAILIHHICEKKIPAPEKYPWFYPMLNAFMSFIYFAYIFGIANLKVLYYSFIKSEHSKIE